MFQLNNIHYFGNYSVFFEYRNSAKTIIHFFFKIPFDSFRLDDILGGM